MKFAKQLEEHATPEWRTKYLDYKQAKKKLKAAAKAVRNVPAQSPEVKRQSPFSSLRDAPVYSYLNRKPGQKRTEQLLPKTRSVSVDGASAWASQNSLERGGGTSLKDEAAAQPNELSPLQQFVSASEDPHKRPQMTRYGSIIGSPPLERSEDQDQNLLSRQQTQASMLELPDPALTPSHSKPSVVRRQDQKTQQGSTDAISPGTRDLCHAPQGQMGHTGNAYAVTSPVDEPERSLNGSRLPSVKQSQRSKSLAVESRPTIMRRVMSMASGPGHKSGSMREHDVALEAYREVDFRKAEFFQFLDRELDMIEDFYRTKEAQATQRLKLLREQLHIMRSQRLAEVEAAGLIPKRKHQSSAVDGQLDPSNTAAAAPNGAITNGNGQHKEEEPDQHDSAHHHHWRQSVVSQMDNALDKVRGPGHLGKNTKAMQDLGTPDSATWRLDPRQSDYTRRFTSTKVSYKSAKTKLKLALSEYYRGLQLLKSYALLNHTAFRKITKKCDKTLPDQPGKKYMVEKINHAHFHASSNIDSLTADVEDLYTRYIEHGNRKMAVAKLRADSFNKLDFTGHTIRAGLFAGVGLVLAAESLARGISQESSTNSAASFLIQIYAGFFLLLVMTGLTCVACFIWKRNKINYTYIFELYGGRILDWRQLLEMTSVFMLLLGVIMSLNFRWVSAESMYTWWPVLLIGLSTLLIVNPFPFFYRESRKWFVETLWRVSVSGFYDPEFRDLFFGDVACSLTYVTGNIYLVPCLYAHDWNGPSQCGSSSSIAFGILTTIPGIWRAAQVLRRFWETGDKFPHLANAGKYGCTILMYVGLMLWRIYRHWHFLALFATIASINSIYCSFWDVVMDFSLGSFRAKYPGLKKELLFSRAWYYYAEIVVDIILRFNWVFYVIFAYDRQHASIVSFSIALSEVFRRAIWAVFRIENEQCANNRRLRANREPDVPYLSSVVEDVAQDPSAPAGVAVGSQHGFVPGTWEARFADSPAGQVLRRVGSTLATAHAEDFVRKKPEDVHEETEIDSDGDEDDE